MENETVQPSASRYTSAPNPSFYETHRLIIKGLIIAGIVLLLMIPASLVRQLVEERAGRRENVIAEVSSKWAGKQTISGPVLMVPYTIAEKSDDGKSMVQQQKWMHILPETLKITGKVLPEVKKRSLYTVALYRSELSMTGNFRQLQQATAKLNATAIDWQNAKLVLGIADVKGLEDEVKLNWMGKGLKFESGMPPNSIFTQGQSVPVDLSNIDAPTFTVQLKIKGSEQLYFLPLGSTTEVALQSAWKHPAFDGNYLPATTEGSKDGFDAHWQVMQASRNYGEVLTSTTPAVAESAFGVRLLQPADGYIRIERTAKYSILFIALTFTVFFFMELVRRRKVHPLQYTLVGLALVVFYSLLLAFSEYMGFNAAYAIAATATVLLVALYVWSLFHSGSTAWVFGAALAGLYGYIFIIIQMEDLSLLFGSIGLFAILAILMYFTRKVAWYGDAQGTARNIAAQ